MIHRLLAVSFLSIVLSLLLAGCSTSTTIHTIDAPIDSLPSISVDQVGRDIITAASRLGWKVTKNEPGMIEANLTEKDQHHMEVSIPYNSEQFTIRYRDSTNRNETDDLFHRHYNKQAVLLEREIQAQLLGVH
ncbi:hypothetical protein [Endozoicomonas sp.]|uniref:hypothetical protein n=1 Tax=Endozoicomonas sp. TaxID=1892382 RepID=UPI002883A7B9|nr:hypothetical protein [Endozoicomonas sp.]